MRLLIANTRKPGVDMRVFCVLGKRGQYKGRKAIEKREEKQRTYNYNFSRTDSQVSFSGHAFN